ncbi:hypothetical protein [Anaeroselena agilis]|uniref:Uncharacterized protein n=1 Tax=Anaeroselena agilis TaxID=3063788 RepID=A0ABU3P1D5_9FIRM|nr:hypothetical protein [Selenomonadales bacterium 4137-cl]
MKRFSVMCLAGPDAGAAWLESGFAAFVAGADEDGRPRRPDVLLVAPGAWTTVGEVWPKVAMAAGAAELSAELAGDYRCLRWRGFTVVTRLEAPLAEPDWDAYRDDAKAVAGAVYGHLLAEVFRETREWCGHTFSVLGR